MGTHPIFESDFDCLTDRKDLKTLPPWVSISVTTRVTTRRDHTEMLQFLMISISVSWSRLTDSWPDVLMLNSTRNLDHVVVGAGTAALPKKAIELRLSHED